MEAKLTQGQEWIAKNPENMSAGDTARLMGVSREHVSRIRKQYVDTGRVQGHGRPGRRKKRIARRLEHIVPGACAGYGCGAARPEGISGARGIHAPHNATHAMLERRGLARRNGPGQRRPFAGAREDVPKLGVALRLEAAQGR